MQKFVLWLHFHGGYSNFSRTHQELWYLVYVPVDQNISPLLQVVSNRSPVLAAVKKTKLFSCIAEISVVVVWSCALFTRAKENCCCCRSKVLFVLQLTVWLAAKGKSLRFMERKKWKKRVGVSTCFLNEHCVPIPRNKQTWHNLVVVVVFCFCFVLQYFLFVNDLIMSSWS